MTLSPWILGAGALGLGVGLRALARLGFKRAKASRGASRSRLWDHFYSLDWGETATNNYGFAPAEGSSPERFQLQMYREHLKAFLASGGDPAHARLLEVSCGRGGGLAHLVETWPGEIEAVGLDLSAHAIAACRARFGDRDRLAFVEGSALDLPFADESFDVVVNVEASNDYGDFPRFFAEVARVLRPGGALLYCDSRKPEDAIRVPEAMAAAGLRGRFVDITENVLQACRLDSDRRRALIDTRAPWFYRALLRDEMLSYAAVEGSAKFQAFADGRRRYVATCAFKAPARAAAPKAERGLAPASQAAG
ncbi:MAG: class I SAM-dependent methyltransferase [Caulobacter sp.]|nr:class I SAM-dependent methyltransferase [Caulobacter sp.]MBW8892209.1 class I SAM-dependent methyltransferase [Burkholderiales bacterium]